MKLLIALEHHFQRDTNGAICANGPPSYAFWKHYLHTFEEVLVLARVNHVAIPAGARLVAEGPGVTFFPLADFRGPAGYLRSYVSLRSKVRQAVHSCNAYMLRVPGLIGRLASAEIRRLKRPYALEVVGDPWQALAPGTWPSPFTPVYRRIMTHSLRNLCRNAHAVRYVSGQVLSAAYRARPGTFTTVFSDVELGTAMLNKEEFERRLALRGERKTDPSRLFRLGFVGSLAQRYKGADLLLQAVARLRGERLNVEVEFAGDGSLRPAMEALAAKLGIADHTRFHGLLPYGQAVFDFLDHIDLCVIPSRTEGLPRAMLEAMARGCPCVGASVGGIPELLESEDRFAPNDAAALADKVAGLLRNREQLATMVRRQYARAQDYSPEKLAQRRHEFYRAVRALSEKPSG